MLADLTATMQIIVGCTIILGVVALAAVVWMIWIRPKFVRAMEDSAPGGSPFTIEGLSELRDRGEISDEEFKRLRLSILGLHPERTRTRKDKDISGSSDAPPRADGQEDREEDDGLGKKET